MGYRLRYSYRAENRVGDHICYISDLTKVHAHFPRWRQEYTLDAIFEEIVAARVDSRLSRAAG